MVRKYSEAEEKELGGLLGVSDLRDAEALAKAGPVLVEDLRRVLRLAPMPHAWLLDAQTWMLGGRVVRWLGGEMQDAVDDGDYDLYSGSHAAFTRTLERMTAAGYTVCRLEGSRRRVPPSDPEADILVRRLPDGRDMHCVRVKSPEGHFLQLMHIPSLFTEGPSVDRLIQQTDLSICQFTLDGRQLHAGPHSWSDFVRRRLRTVHIRSARRTAGRLFKYSLRGFWPYPQAVRAVSGKWLSERLTLR